MVPAAGLGVVAHVIQSGNVHPVGGAIDAMLGRLKVFKGNHVLGVMGHAKNSSTIPDFLQAGHMQAAYWSHSVLRSGSS